MDLSWVLPEPGLAAGRTGLGAASLMVGVEPGVVESKRIESWWWYQGPAIGLVKGSLIRVTGPPEVVAVVTRHVESSASCCVRLNGCRKNEKVVRVFTLEIHQFLAPNIAGWP